MLVVLDLYRAGHLDWDKYLVKEEEVVVLAVEVEVECWQLCQGHSFHFSIVWSNLRFLL